MAAIPRRASVYADGHDFEASSHWVICLDSVVQRNVVGFDMDAGTVTRHCLDADGRLCLNEAGDEIGLETLNGMVTVSDRRSVA